LLAVAEALALLAGLLYRVLDRVNQQDCGYLVLHEVVVSAVLDSLDAEVAVVQPGEYDDRRELGGFDDVDERLQPCAVGKPEVEQYHVHCRLRQSVQPCCQVGLVVHRRSVGRRPVEFDPPELGVCHAEHLLDESHVAGVVLDEQDVECVAIHRHPRSAGDGRPRARTVRTS
jgi:hypothetical protein